MYRQRLFFTFHYSYSTEILLICVCVFFSFLPMDRIDRVRDLHVIDRQLTEEIHRRQYVEKYHLKFDVFRDRLCHLSSVY